MCIYVCACVCPCIWSSPVRVNDSNTKLMCLHVPLDVFPSLYRITSNAFDIPAGKEDIALVMRRRPRTLPDQSLYSPPSQESVNPIVSRLRWESEMWEKFWSTSVYILVTTLILIIVYGQKEPMSILLTTNANNMFIASTFTDGQKFYEVSIAVLL